MEIRKYYRYWAVYDADEQLVCITLYKKGAKEVVRRLTGIKKKEVANHDEP